MKAQPALEFLSVYSWTLISVILFAVVAAVLATAQTKQIYPPSYCYVTPTFPCYAMYVMSNSVGSVALMIFTNNLGAQISFPHNSFRVYPTYTNTSFTGQCIPTNAVSGTVISCNATLSSGTVSGYNPALGTELNPNFVLSYNVCGAVCSNSLPVYNTSGEAQLVVSPYAPYFRNFVELASPASFGTVSPGNGTYNYGSQITISATANSGHTFLGWSCTGLNCYNGTNPTNTITLSNFVVETANFR